ncbi:hypothetical protein UFOVP795_6 [uncultured Caudovirales phage]|uniref:Uncharacterized protein n=1 Tax=uncultured Caudovirales phage TaxID=2100421 RepID=A0A6J5NTC9_9CAUD|nr:hypothetical protein UFOVP795_6 [uncultured Caudovirales phage]
MQLTLKAIFIDGTSYEVETNLMALVAWERKYKRKASDMAAGIGVEDLTFLCYEASRLNKITVPATLDMFITSLKNIEVVEQQTDLKADPEQ